MAFSSFRLHAFRSHPRPRAAGSRIWRRAGTLLVLLVSLLIARYATAQQQPSTADRETARNQMDEGNARRDRHDLKGALDSFIAADMIMHVPTTGLEVARTEVLLGQLVEARDKLLEVVRLAAKSNEPRAFTEARITAQALSDDLDVKIPSVRIVLRGVPEGAPPSVAIDGSLVPSAALIAWRRVNPGHHDIVAHASTLEQHQEVTLRERERKEIVIDFPSPPPAATTPDVSPTPPPPVAPPAAPAPVAPPADTGASAARASPWKTVMYAGFGVGAAGILAGSITGILSITDTHSAKQFCNAQNQCQPAADSDISAAKTTGNISTAAFIVAGVGVGAGVLGLILGHTAKSSSTTGHLEPWFGPASAGLSGTF